MWMVNPKFLCKKHLLGEHGELHKFRPTFEKQHNINGRLSPKVQIEPLSMQSRHNQLACEMLLRGMNHNSPYEQPNLSYLTPQQVRATVNVLEAKEDLISRCSECAKRFKKYSNFVTPLRMPKYGVYWWAYNDLTELLNLNVNEEVNTSFGGTYRIVARYDNVIVVDVASPEGIQEPVTIFIGKAND